MMNVNAIRPDAPTVAVEGQAVGEQPVAVTPEGRLPLGTTPEDMTGMPVCLCCPVCGGKLSDIRRQGGRFLTHCYSCHFEFSLETEAEA